MGDVVFSPGMLVSLPGRRGVGTLVSVDGEHCRVALFHSIDNSVIEEHSRDHLSRAFIGPETRVYVAETYGWRVGRVTNFDPVPHPWIEYVVRFPNGQVEDLSEHRLRVRVFKPYADPSEVLARGGGESQYLHDRRWRALSQCVRLRGAAAGLTAALSAKVELAPYQLAAVQRMLTNPILRFLLADEVGMGKTIEAGLVVRQCLIDDPTRTIQVIAPPGLLEQWRAELLDRCDLAVFEDRIAVSPYDNLPTLDASADLLIVDEAHNLLEDRAWLTPLTDLALATPRLLLLSATPALGDPRQLLSLLHMLDPAAYGANDLAKLEARLLLGRDLGRILLTLSDDTPEFLLKHAVTDLADRLPRDTTAIELSREIVEHGEVSRIADLRQHLADTYRVHQRLIRARRRDAPLYFQPRGVLVSGRRDHLRIEVDEDLRWPEILIGLDDWREDFRGQMGSEGRSTAEMAGNLFSAADAIGTRQTGNHLTRAPAHLREALQADPGVRSLSVVAAETIANLGRVVARDGIATPKIVAFATTGHTVAAVALCLTDLGLASQILTTDMPPADVRDAVVRFSQSDGPGILVCDCSGEEGLNLTFADAIVHIDVPLSVSRMEQRIGRVDRFGRTKRIFRQRVVLPSDDETSPWSAWVDVLTDGFGIFETSASDVQFILSDLEAELALAFLERGAEGMRERIPELQERLTAARRAADEQYALDAVALDDGGINLAEAIEDSEADEPAIQVAVESWLVSTLHLKRQDLAPEIVSYGWSRNTLVPRNPWESEFGLTERLPLTWRRRSAIHRDASLLRPGAPLIDAMERHLRWDDRGSAFATWRVDPAVPSGDIAWTGFRFCFVVEPGLDQNMAIFRQIDRHGLSRRAQVFLPPATEVLQLDLSGEQAPPWVVDLLARSYSNEVRPQGGRDFNLCSRPTLMESVVPPAMFARLCRDVRATAEASIRSNPAFTSRIADASARAERDNGRRLRLGVDETPEHAAMLIAAVCEPRLRLDSMGLFVLSRNPPARAT